MFLQLTLGTTPTSKTAGNFKIRAFSAGSMVLSYEGSDPFCVWPVELPAGTYTISAERKDTDGLRLGDELNTTVEWSAAGVPTAQVPVGAFIGPM